MAAQSQAAADRHVSIDAVRGFAVLGILLMNIVGMGLPSFAYLDPTYAGGAKSIADLEEVTKLGNGRIHLTIGSAMDIFGGTGVRYQDVVEFNRRLA